jgi:glycosyltransferase involved in cell wall biosynthesis
LHGLVLFAGRVERTELADYLNAADIYVSTSYSDGTSLSLLEAMATGLPAVVTDVPANLEWIRDGYNGYIAKRGDAESVGESMQRLLDDPAQCRIFGGRTLEIAATKADWNRNFEKFLQMFEQVCSHSVEGQRR